MKRITIDSTLDNAKIRYGTLTLTLRDRNGNIIQRTDQPVESYIRQYWALHYAIHGGRNDTFLLPLSGSGRTFDQPLGYDAGGSANAYNSIVVGSGNNMVTYNDTTLQTLILHGNTTGRLAASAPVMGYNDATGQVTISREFTNNFNGTDPSVNEVGVAIGIANVTTTGGEVMLAIRDLTIGTIVVLFESTLTVQYTLELPFGTSNYGRLFNRHCIGRDDNELALYDSNGTLVNSATWSDAPTAMSFVSLVGNDDRGIVIGMASNATTFNTYALHDPIAHGNSTNEAFYYDSAITTREQVTSTSNLTAWYLTRTFINKNTSPFTVREIGLVSNYAIGATNNTYLFDRRVVSDTTLDTNESLTVNWLFRYNF
jgi:hypothetical protein